MQTNIEGMHNVVMSFGLKLLSPSTIGEWRKRMVKSKEEDREEEKADQPLGPPTSCEKWSRT